jgi:hypothetical protein
MAAASDAQVQQFVTTVTRPRCQQLVELVAAVVQDIAACGSVYAALTEQNPTWSDTNPTNPPNLLTPANWLAINEVMNNFVNTLNADANFAVAKQACVNPINPSF